MTDHWRPAPDPGSVGTGTCGHTDPGVHVPKRPNGAVCDSCPPGAAWVNLLRCLTCGHVGCCDSSAGKHAHSHAHAHGHPLACSLRPGDVWAWCYEDELYLVPVGKDGEA